MQRARRKLRFSTRPSSANYTNVFFKNPSWPDWPLIRFGSSTEAEGCSGRSSSGARRTYESLRISRGLNEIQSLCKNAMDHRGKMHALCGTKTSDRAYRTSCNRVHACRSQLTQCAGLAPLHVCSFTLTTQMPTAC